MLLLERYGRRFVQSARAAAWRVAHSLEFKRPSVRKSLKGKTTLPRAPNNLGFPEGGTKENTRCITYIRSVLIENEDATLITGLITMVQRVPLRIQYTF